MFDAFTPNEQIIFRFTIDDTTVDSDGSGTFGDYSDPAGFYEIIGASSGASVTTNNGARLNVESNNFEIEPGDAAARTAAGVIDLVDDIDFPALASIFSNVNDLPTVLAELLGTNVFDSGGQAEVTLGDGAEVVSQAEFFIVGDDSNTATFSVLGSDPIDPPETEIPEPASLGLLAAGLAGIGIVAWCRRRGGVHRA